MPGLAGPGAGGCGLRSSCRLISCDERLRELSLDVVRLWPGMRDRRVEGAAVVELERVGGGRLVW